MNNAKNWLSVAFFLVLLGGTIFAAAMSMLQWDFTKLSTVQYETNDYKITDDYKNISIVTDTADIVFALSEDKSSTVTCFEAKTEKHKVEISDGTLTIQIKDTRKWYENIGIFFRAPQITIMLPQKQYGELLMKSSTGDVEIPGDLKFESIDISVNTGDVISCASALENVGIKTTTGRIFIENISAETLDLSATTGGITVTNAMCVGDMTTKVSTGKTVLSNITCSNIASDGDTGDISLNHVIAAESMTVKRNTGDIKFDNSDAAEIFAETDTGDVTGTLQSSKVFIIQTDTGDVTVPQSVSGGKCEIRTGTGDVKLKVKN